MANCIFYLIPFVAVCFFFVRSQYEHQVELSKFLLYIPRVGILMYTYLKAQNVVYTIYGFVKYTNIYVCEAMILKFEDNNLV